MISINQSESKKILIVNYSGSTKGVSVTYIMKNNISKIDIFKNDQGFALYTKSGKKFSFKPDEISYVNGKPTKVVDLNSTIETSNHIVTELMENFGKEYFTNTTGTTGVVTNLNNSNQQFDFDPNLLYSKVSFTSLSDAKGVLSVDITLSNGNQINHSFFSNDSYYLELSESSAPITSILITELSGNPTDIIYNILNK